MVRFSGTMLLVALTALAGATAAEPPDRLSGRYGHDASEPAYEPVWEARREGEQWRAGNLVEGGFSDAYRMSAAGRRLFWEKMHWPLDTASQADCVSWGQAPPELLQLLQETPRAAAPDTFGEALICHVPATARQAIDWLADESEDWFYYDAMAGVMSVRQLQ